MSKTLINNFQTGTIVKENGKVKKVLLFDCVECEQAIPHGVKIFHKETETEWKIYCGDCVKKAKASKKAIIEILVEKFIKEGYKMYKRLREKDYQQKQDERIIFSSEEWKQMLRQGTKTPTDYPLFIKFVVGARLFRNETGWGFGRYEWDKEYYTHFGDWCYYEAYQLGVKNPITSQNEEEVLLEWFNKWETFEDLFAFLEEEELCLK
jgi:hypothetical protein